MMRDSVADLAAEKIKTQCTVAAHAVSTKGGANEQTQECPLPWQMLPDEYADIKKATTDTSQTGTNLSFF
jgi:hypothetical protein